MNHLPRCEPKICRAPEMAGAEEPEVVRMASDIEIRTLSAYRRLAILTADLMGYPERKMGRRGVPEHMAEVIYSYNGTILDPGGHVASIGDDDISLAFNSEESFRWISAFVQFAFENEPKIRPREKLVPRLRLLYLTFQISRPNAAYWVMK